jgi:thiazole/oxazole-forming peptide maturase SagC family component
MTHAISQPRVGLAPSVRLLPVERNVIRMRWGIWNFQEVTVDLRPEPPAVQQAFSSFFAALADGGTASSSFEQYPNLSPVERANLELALTELRQAGFLAYDQPANRGADMARVLLGNMDVYGGGNSIDAAVAFTSDSSSATHYMSSQAEALGAKLHVLSPNFMRDLHDYDLTSGMGGVVALDAYRRFREYVNPYDSIVVCISQASILALRNLNRLACSLEKPIIVGMIDGPFVTVVGADSPRTGCLECFEQRSLSRLEDHISYHNFVASGVSGSDNLDARGSGVESLLCAFLTNEAILLQSLGTSRFIGRALSIYLPTYEMQAQDVLRIATCPACGHVSSDVMQEINFNSRVIIDRHVEEALGVKL